MTKESVTLYYREGSSDKVYQTAIEPRGEQFTVNFAFGRRGSTMQTGTKTYYPVEYNTAKSIFNRLVNEKKAKGYTEGRDGTPYTGSEKEKRATGIECQLLNPIPETDALIFIAIPDFVMQEKFDGERILVRKEGSEITGINRKGLTVGLPEPIVRSVSAIREDCLIDGEAVGDKLHAFDLLSISNQDIRPAPYSERFSKLLGILIPSSCPAILPAETTHTEFEKQGMFKRMKDARAEGVVFKRLDAPYVSGRPNNGTGPFKCKFVESCSCIVGKRQRDGKRSACLLLWDTEGREVFAGFVTIPANHEMPTPGDVVEVKYLYAHRASGCLYQPVYSGKRDDISSHECTTTQLKFKAGDEEDS